MKHFVRVISTIILLVYSIENVILSAGAIYGIMRLWDEIIYGFGGTIDGSPTPILDGIGKVFLGIVSFFLVISVLVCVSEVVFIVVNYIKAITKQSFKYYRNISIFSLLLGVLNAFWIFVLLTVLGNAVYKDEVLKIIEQISLVLIVTNIFMGFWSILNILASRECISNGL